MSYIAEFKMPTEAFPFGETLVKYPDIRIEVERIIPTHESAMPYFWVWGHSPEKFIEEAEHEHEISDTRLLESVNDGGLFRAEWSPNASIIRGLKQLQVTILASEGTSEQWRFVVRAEERRKFIEFKRIFETQGISISLTRIHDLADIVAGHDRALTPEQRETLLKAYEEGYYENPRKITQQELGDHFGISSRAISDRLRRGYRNLIESILIPGVER